MTMKTDDQALSSPKRQAWMALLARTPTTKLKEGWSRLAPTPDFVPLRGPETGLVMVEGRAGGSGQRFNLGEATVTRCTVRLATGELGHSYALGRDREKAVLAAAFDALLQDKARHDEIEREVLAPLREDLANVRASEARKVAATRVDFFTVAREASE